MVDDIYTTGSTIEACTNVLKNNGIKQVYFITLCIEKASRSIYLIFRKEGNRRNENGCKELQNMREII